MVDFDPRTPQPAAPVARESNGPRFDIRGSSNASTPPPVPDTTPPVVGNYDPLPTASISPTTTISFDVTEETGPTFHCLFVVARFAATGDREVVHDGVAFSPKYVASSSRAAIANGFRYTVLRAGGWLASPTFEVFATDPAGNEAS